MADTIIFPEVSVIKILEIMLGKDLAENLSLRLFVNDVDFTTTPEDIVLGDFTEMSTHGYAAKTLTMASWAVPTISSSKAVSAYAAQTWTFTAASTVSVYGYYMRMASTSELIMACKFASARPITNAGETISVTPEFRLPVVDGT